MEFPGAVYHVIARGNERRNVFRDDVDRRSYLERLAQYRARFGFRLYAYCLMPNHIHLSIETGDVRLSRVMLALQGSYAQAFNRRHGRVGHLFQGRYKAFLVQRDPYLLALIRYIHENPVAAAIAPRTWMYRWSSDRSYRSLDAPPWLDVEQVLALFSANRRRAVQQYRAFMARREVAHYDNAPLLGAIVKGDPGFAVQVLRREAQAMPLRGLTPERVARAVATVIGIGEDDLIARRRVPDLSLWRALAAYIGRELAGISLAGTSRCLRRHESVLVRQVGKLEQRLASDPHLRRNLETVVRLLRSDAPGPELLR